MTAPETEEFLRSKIPLAHAMGVRVERCGADEMVLTAPLEPNHNHLGTAFGGSLSALATLTGYAFLWRELGEPDAHIVIRRSELDYRHPVSGLLRAVCRPPEESALGAFRNAFHRAGKGRVRLRVDIEEDGRVCVMFSGDFVALR